MHQLSMPHGYFTVDTYFDDSSLQIDGATKVEFNVTTNPGQPHQALSKVASGGELSRIALAIQVITAKMDTPALILMKLMWVSVVQQQRLWANCSVN